MGKITERGLENNLGKEAMLGLPGVGVSGFLLKDDKGFYIGVLSGIRYRFEEGEPVIINRRQYEVNLKKD